MTRVMRRMRKYLVVVACIAMVLGVAIGGTVAWLQMETDTVTNTFSPTDISLTLTETGATGEGTTKTKTYDIVPGTDLQKDPKVTVMGGSEACWVFLEVNEQNWPSVTEENGTTRKVNYAITTEWTPYTVSDAPAGKTYYYKAVTESPTNTEIQILVDNEVTVSNSLTKTEMAAITSPSLTFKAAAIQQDNIGDVDAAWAQVENYFDY